MKFNKKSLVKVAILSAILGLNGMCFNDVVNGAAEVAVEEAVVEEAVVRNGKCKECGTDNTMFNFTTGESLCNGCISKYRRNMIKYKDTGIIAWVMDEQFIKDYKLTEEDRKIMNELLRKHAVQHRVAGYMVAEDGFPKVRVENKNTANEEICPICCVRKPIKTLCCGNLICANCILKQNEKRRWGDGVIRNDCPFCRCSGNIEMKDQATGAKFDLSRKSAWNEMVKLAKELKQRVAEKENSEERTLADDLNRFDGDRVSFAREQENYANQRLAELTNERAWQLLDEGRVKEVEHMFDEADSYRKDKEILREDIRDEKIEKTSSNCSQNACCEPTSFEKGEYKDAYVNTSYVDIDGVQVEIS